MQDDPGDRGDDGRVAQDVVQLGELRAGVLDLEPRHFGVRRALGEDGREVLLGGLEVEAPRAVLALRGLVLRCGDEPPVQEELRLVEAVASRLERDAGLGDGAPRPRCLHPVLPVRELLDAGHRLQVGHLRLAVIDSGLGHVEVHERLAFGDGRSVVRVHRGELPFDRARHPDLAPRRELSGDGDGGEYAPRLHREPGESLLGLRGGGGLLARASPGTPSHR